MAQTDAPPPSPSRLAEAWVSVGVGALLLLFFPRILEYFLTPASFTWTFNDRDGAPLAYTSSMFFVLDCGVLALAVSFLADGVLLLVARHRAALMAGVAISAATALINIVVVLWIRSELGLQLLPALGALFAGYMALQQMTALRAPPPV